jgi:ATP-dependent DNA ligase
MKTFPTLYLRSSAGALQQWSIRVDDNVITVSWGQVGGAIQKTNEFVKSGKNLGKKNATTPSEQAESQAASKWLKKIKREGYVEDAERAKRGERDMDGGIPPMLAPSKMNPKHLIFLLDMQPKLDGVRCIVMIVDGKVSLWSRRCEEMTKALPHIAAAYAEAYAKIPGIFVFDGEAYRHGWSLQKISTFVRKKNEARPGHEQIGHYVYDMPSAGGCWLDRKAALAAAALPNQYVHRVETTTVATLEEAWAYHDVKVSEGYEGAMGRNHCGEYEEDTRSQHLNKFKIFVDHEFKIIGVKDGVGKFEGKAIFICEMPEKPFDDFPENLTWPAGATFDCTSPGTMEDKAEYFVNFEKYRGLLHTVKHKGYTEDGLPWHPVGKAVRDYD